MILTCTYKVDISKPIHPTPLEPMLVCQDYKANRLAFEIYDGDEPYSPSGSCVGLVKRADGAAVPITGVVSNNLLYIDLPQEAYAIEGPVTVVVRSVTAAAKTAIFFGYGNVLNGESGTIINPGNVIPDITDLLAAIDQMQQATAAANAAAEKAVRYDSAMSLTAAEKATARINISAASVLPTGDGTGDHDGLFIMY